MFPGQTCNHFHLKNWLTVYLAFIEVTTLKTLSPPPTVPLGLSSVFSNCLETRDTFDDGLFNRKSN